MSESVQGHVLLVVDDEPVAGRLAAGLLTRAFPDSKVEFCDGARAFEAVERIVPALVLTDLYMPVTDGLAIVQELRIRRPDLPVVVMTAHGSEQAAVKALRLGAASYVPKQRLAEELVETVKWVLAVRHHESTREEVFDYMHGLERKFSLPSRTELITPVVTLLQEDLRRLDVCPEEDLNRIGVAMTETLMNAMVHGNLGLSSKLLDQGHGEFRARLKQRMVEPPYCERRVHVHVRADRDEAVCTVRDEGEGFDPECLPDPTHPDQVMRVHGRGLLLIRTFMDDVRFNAKGNEITLVKRRSKKA